MSKKVNKAAKMSDTVTDQTVKQVNKPNIDGGKKMADNTNQRKLMAARDVLKGRYSEIPLLDAEGKKTKQSMDWVAIFDQASGDAEVAHSVLQTAKDTYASESGCIAQLFLSIARISKTPDVFATDYKNMALVWKTTNNVNKLPQAIIDAASVIKRAWGHNIDPTKAKSITGLRADIKTKVKAENKAAKDDGAPTELDTDVTELMNHLTTIMVLLKAEGMLTEYAALVGNLKAIADDYDVTNEDDSIDNDLSEQFDKLAEVIEDDEDLGTTIPLTAEQAEVVAQAN